MQKWSDRTGRLKAVSEWTWDVWEERGKSSGVLEWWAYIPEKSATRNMVAKCDILVGNGKRQLVVLWPSRPLVMRLADLRVEGNTVLITGLTPIQSHFMPHVPILSGELPYQPTLSQHVPDYLWAFFHAICHHYQRFSTAPHTSMKNFNSLLIHQECGV